jgi:small-conductance mechanosensitive channel
MDISVRIILSILTLLVALALGVFIRYVLVKRFKKASLSYRLAGAVGVSVILFLLLLALILVLVILTGDVTLLATLLGTPGAKLTPFQSVVTLLWNIAESGIVCVLGLMIAGWLKTLVDRRLEEQEIDANARVLLVRASYAGLLIIVFFVVLLIWDVQIALPVTILTGVLTFALRDLIKDLVAGVYILAEQQFHIGDQITISSSTGTVTHISIRVTTLRLVTGEAIIIPNGHFLDESVRNNTRYKDRRATITAHFTLADYDEDTTPFQIAQTIKSTAIVSQEEEPAIIVNAVTGRLEGYNPGGGGYSNATVRLTVRFWVESGSRDAVTAVMEALKKAFPRADFLVQEFAASA